MNRRSFLRTIGAAGASGLYARSLRGAAAPKRKANIIFVMLDDAGIGDFGCYGQEKIKTPVMDRMAKEGMRFTQAYTASPVCAPCRCTLMTGLHSGHCTRRGNRTTGNPPGAGKDRGLVPLRPDDFTIAAMLKKAGYVTGGYGKWGLGNPGTTGTPEKHGFDHFYGYLDQVHAHNYYTDYLIRDGRRETVGQGGKNPYSHHLIHKAAMDFIRKYKDRPFLLYLPYTLPHGKYVIPDNAPYDKESWTTTEKNYAAMITLADRDVGQVLGLLKELGLDDNTIVFYTSDNGPNPPFLKRFNSAAGLRGVKRSLYEGGIRMPMVVRWPGKVPAGVVSDCIWTFVDFMPTAADIAGTSPPDNMDGMSILPTLLGRKQEPHEMIYWEFHSPFHQAVRMGKFKGVRFGTAEPLELYDINADPGERNNIAARHKDVVGKMEAFLAGARTESKYWPARATRGKKKGGKKGGRKGK